MKPRTYLDFNATSPMPLEVSEVVSKGFKNYGNPSSPHLEGRQAKRALEEAREQIAAAIGLPCREGIIFTSSATEAASLALHSNKIHCAEIEHLCVKKWSKVDLPVSKLGLVRLENPEISALQTANSETGERLKIGH